MFGIGWKNLVRDRSRLAISLVGVAFAVFLMLLQSGIFFGFVFAASAVIDNCPADLWVVLAKTPNFESAWHFPENDVGLVEGLPGVAWADPMIHTFAYMKLPNGEARWAQVIGFNPDSGVGGPWELVQGSLSDLKRPGTYFIDESSLPQFPGIRVGDRLESFDKKLEIVGLTRGAKTYTTYPILFTSYRTCQEQNGMLENEITFIVAKLQPGADVLEVKERLRRLAKFDVYTKDEFSRKTRVYWATKTGIGVGIGLTILLGFAVGLVIVGQTMYTATVERLREYATLKTLGATNLEICLLIWFQAVLVGLGGYVIGAALASGLKAAYSGEAVAVYFPPWIYGVMLCAAEIMCLGASMLSIRRVLRVAPASVFRV